MPATSRSGEVFSRRSARFAPRLALEVDDHHVVPGDQDLAEVVVAVDARAKAGRRRSSASWRSVAASAVSRPSSLSAFSAAAVAERAAGGAEPCQQVPGFGVGRIDPGFEMSPFDRFGGKRRIVGGNREGAMQFGRAPAEQFADVEREAEAVARQLLVRVVGADGDLVEIALERVDDDAPGIALVRHEFEGGGKRRFARPRRRGSRWSRDIAACWRTSPSRSGSGPPRHPAARPRAAGGRA